MKTTHTGQVIGSSTLYPSYLANLRETKTMWIEDDGTKWRKINGSQPGIEYPRRRLDVATVKPLPVKAQLIRVDEFTVSDFQMDAAEYQKLLECQHTKTPVLVTGVGCEVDGDWEHDYHDIQLPDGTVYDAISGYHLKRLTT